MWRAEAARNWWGFFHWRDDWPQPGPDPPRDWDKQGDSVNARYRVFTIASGHCELGRCLLEQWLGMIRMWGLISGQCPYPAWQGTHGPGSRQCGPVNTYCNTVSLYYHSSPNWSQPADTQQIDSYQPQDLPSAATKLAPVQYLQTLLYFFFQIYFLIISDSIEMAEEACSMLISWIAGRCLIMST